MPDVLWNAEDNARNSRLQSGWAVELPGKFALKGEKRVPDLGRHHEPLVAPGGGAANFETDPRPP